MTLIIRSFVATRAWRQVFFACVLVSSVASIAAAQDRTGNGYIREAAVRGAPPLVALGQAAPATTAAAAFYALLEHALRDPAVRIRMEVLPLASAQPEGWRRQTFDMLLCDQHAPIKAIAHAELVRLTPDFDAAARYRELLIALANARPI